MPSTVTKCARTDGFFMVLYPWSRDLEEWKLNYQLLLLQEEATTFFIYLLSAFAYASSICNVQHLFCNLVVWFIFSCFAKCLWANAKSVNNQMQVVSHTKVKVFYIMSACPSEIFIFCTLEIIWFQQSKVAGTTKPGLNICDIHWIITKAPERATAQPLLFE